jgi:flavin reductase (DIM6/NTAB) family NADH-FMN oxidoreductase RutF
MEYSRKSVAFWDSAATLLDRLQSKNGGIICTVVDNAGKVNAITLGWGLLGPHHENDPIVVIAVCPPRYSFRFLEETGEFVLAVPDDALRGAADLCGTKSGRDIDKFAAAGLTKMQSQHVTAPSIAECLFNVECRVYTKVSPPHMLLTPRHRERPLTEQHTIYFAKALGTYTYETIDGTMTT